MDLMDLMVIEAMVIMEAITTEPTDMKVLVVGGAESFLLPIS